MRRTVMAGVGMIAGAAALALAVAASAAQGSGQGMLPESLRELTEAREVDVRDQSGNIVLRGAFTTVAATGETKVELTGSSGKGRAEVEIDVKNGSRRSELEIDVKGLSPNTTYAVHLNGERAGELVTNAKGDGEVELTSTVPAQ